MKLFEWSKQGKKDFVVESLKIFPVSFIFTYFSPVQFNEYFHLNFLNSVKNVLSCLLTNFFIILQGENDFVVESLEASFRYPMDFTYHIQNFSAIPYHKTVKPDQEATVAYSFIPADAFAGRPIGLSVNLAYR